MVVKGKEGAFHLCVHESFILLQLWIGEGGDEMDAVFVQYIEIILPLNLVEEI